MKIIIDAYKIIATVPAIKNLPTVLIIGLPNVGKSTLMKNITGSNVEIKDYPFTTKKLQLGYLEYKYLNFQLVDSPGLLDRTESKQNAIEKQTILALKHLANSIIFVIDVKQSLEGQKNQVKKFLKENKPYILVFNKAKSLSKEDLEEYKTEFLQNLGIEKDLIFDLEQKVVDKEVEESLEKIKNLIYRQNKIYFMHNTHDQ